MEGGGSGGWEWGGMCGRKSGSSQTRLGRVQIPPNAHPPPITTSPPIHLPQHHLLPLRRRLAADYLCCNISAAFLFLAWALRDTRDEHVDLQRRGVGSICSPTEKEAVRNKQTDRQVGRRQKNPTAASQHAAYNPVRYYPFIYLNLPPLTL